MARRTDDWMRQARRDLDHARLSAEAGDHEWACFAAQQAAEKAVKALFQSLHREAWGHTVHKLLQALPEERRPPEDLVDRARRLDRHYILTRYPNGFETGAPADFYIPDDARTAIADGEAIVAFCSDHLA